MGKLFLANKDQDLESQPNLLDQTDKVINILMSIRSNLGVASFLMDGESHVLESPFGDFEIWFSDMKDRLDTAIEEVTKIRTV